MQTGVRLISGKDDIREKYSDTKNINYRQQANVLIRDPRIFLIMKLKTDQSGLRWLIYESFIFAPVRFVPKEDISDEK